jgi:hypothetical protein
MRLVENIKKELSNQMSDIRAQTQFFVKESIDRIEKSSGDLDHAPPPKIAATKTQLARINSEYKIADEELPVEGYLDLLLTHGEVDLIIDFKSSLTIHDEYWQQLELYAWLWFRSDANKRKGDCIVEVVAGSMKTERRTILTSQISEIEKVVVSRIKNAKSLIGAQPVSAILSEEGCKFCTVKPVCKPFWNSVTDLLLVNTWQDIWVKTIEYVGGGVWSVQLGNTEVHALLVLGDTDDGSVNEDQELRLLNVFVNTEDETRTVIRLGNNSEIFRLASH